MKIPNEQKMKKGDNSKLSVGYPVSTSRAPISSARIFHIYFYIAKPEHKIKAATSTGLILIFLVSNFPFLLLFGLWAKIAGKACFFNILTSR